MAAAPVIAIDGPGGAGKGSLAQLLAAELGFHLLDSGALYRATALACLRDRLDAEDVAAVAGRAASLAIGFAPGPPGEPPRVLLAGREVDGALRDERTGALASRLAAEPVVRAALLERQRAFRRPPGLVADGRDMGTVVFPDAELKVFLTASVEERARRRHKQLIEKGISVNLEALIRDIGERDRQDRERAAAPLVPAGDAIHLDTTGLELRAVLDRVLALARARGIAPGRG